MDDRDLTLREALASHRLKDFIQQEEARGMELANGSEFERALALLTTQRACATGLRAWSTFFSASSRSR